ncbi:hypothetical protein GUJ93_ZPchr0011g28541 [Zizania palustris]|uniref:Uncharacterized protein n=1 Tax=Zizania palustris TaxID=103762 RepID=A0A8J5WKE2_ZIZPA|nr:hypothetical protein GUJ93_ZPchr0011g28541 [Zizania palustris]
MRAHGISSFSSSSSRLAALAVLLLLVVCFFFHSGAAAATRVRRAHQENDGVKAAADGLVLPRGVTSGNDDDVSEVIERREKASS